MTGECFEKSEKHLKKQVVCANLEMTSSRRAQKSAYKRLEALREMGYIE